VAPSGLAAASPLTELAELRSRLGSVRELRLPSLSLVAYGAATVFSIFQMRA